MKVLCVSDIHMKWIDTPPGDLLLVAGDFSFSGSRRELEWYEEWLTAQPQPWKVWISGNHEKGLDPAFGGNEQLAYDIAERTGTVYLHNQMFTIDGVNIWGVPEQPAFCNWAWNRMRGAELRAIWECVPEQTDILLTHGPPYGYGDLCPNGFRAGCKDMLWMLENRTKVPEYIVCGHIHLSNGEYEIKREDGKVVKVINAAICDEGYKATNPVRVFDINRSNT
jgi:Icc-related predicted phosphoesterase